MAVVCRLYLNMSEMLTGRAIDSNYTKEAWYKSVFIADNNKN
jgi:hypothetical protein